MPSRIDDLRNKIGVREMEKGDRETLLKRFKEGGGEVIDENPQTSTMSFDREKQRKILEEMTKDGGHSVEFNRDLEYRKKSAPDQAPRLDIFLWLEAFFNGVVRLLSRQIPKRFFQYFSRDILPAMRGAELIAIRIFQVNQEHAQKLQVELTKSSLVYFELIEKFGNIYNEAACRNMLSGYHADPGRPVVPESLEEEIKALFKQIYLIKPHQSGLTIALRVALKLQDTLTKKADSPFQIKNADLFIEQLMEKLFHKLYLLLCILRRKRIRLYSEDLDNYLDIKVDERVGYYTPQDIIARIQEEMDRKAHGSQDSEPKKDKESAESKKRKETDETLPNFILSGLEMLAAVDRSAWLDVLAREGLKYDDFSDKTLVVYVILKEFEHEYSFLLTSAKITMDVIYENKRKISMRDRLNDLYVRIESILALFQNYWEAVKDIKDSESAIVVDEVGHFNKMQGFEARRGSLSFKIKSVAFQFFRDLNQVISVLFEDMNGEKKIIQNAGDILHFDPAIEGKKKLDGKSVAEVIHSVYDFIRAVCMELDEYGNLGGVKVHLDMNYFDILKSTIDNQRKLLKTTEEAEDKAAEAEGKLSKEEMEKRIDESSIFNEIDDILKKD